MTDERFARAREVLRPVWESAEAIEHQNYNRLLRAFRTAGVGSHDLQGSNGYGYGDGARAKLEEVYAMAFGGETALVRPQIASGTHALWLCLSALLRPGDHLLFTSGPPYDTLRKAISGESEQSLRSQGITYTETPLTPEGTIDLEAVEAALRPNTRLLYVQRSRGYAWRPAIGVDQIEALCRWRNRVCPTVPVMIDNCYSEFVEATEPGTVGADLVAGSLIKNPGGTVAPGGGYIVGRRDLVDRIADRMTAPGLGRKIGPSYGLTPTLFQGLFMAPHFVRESLCGLSLVAWILEEEGLEVSPRWDQPKADAVLAILLGSPERLVTFCQAVQEASPIDHYAHLEPGPMPGYDVDVVMAAGTFVQGASSELTADGPIRPPYAAYMQGGVSRQHVRIALAHILKRLHLPVVGPTR